MTKILIKYINLIKSPDVSGTDICLDFFNMVSLDRNKTSAIHLNLLR